MSWRRRGAILGAVASRVGGSRRPPSARFVKAPPDCPISTVYCVCGVGGKARGSSVALSLAGIQAHRIRFAGRTGAAANRAAANSASNCSRLALAQESGVGKFPFAPRMLFVRRCRRSLPLALARPPHRLSLAGVGKQRRLKTNVSHSLALISTLKSSAIHCVGFRLNQLELLNALVSEIRNLH